ncbi:MAG: lamin tail domain-containing protein [Clostridia bacterium]|nr:lamin tail domain-containing protein [Clostridia bacterium]
MDTNTGNGIHGRRSASRATKLRRRRQRLNFLLLAGMIAAIALIVLVTPKEPLQQAVYTIASEDGTVGDGVRLVTQYEGLRISEVMPSNRSAVTDENGEYPDWIEIWNSSDAAMNLKGLGLSDRSDSIRFLFPDMTLPADGRMIIFASNSNQADPGLPFHAKFKLSSVGETVYLYDPNAYLIDSCKYPILGSDESWALTAEGFQAVEYFSPGFENSPEGHQAYRESIMVSGGALIINEVMADPMTGLRDEDDELSDWVEIYNTTANAVSLDNYALSDNESKPLKWRFPKGASIPGYGYYVVFCSGKDKVEAVSGVPHSNFSISAERETIILADSRGHVVDRVMIDNLAEDCSYGRNDQGTMQVFQTATPGLPNNQIGFNQMDSNLRAMNPSGVYISEVLASNDSITTYPSGGNTDWIELYNSSSQSVDLSGYGLSDRLTRGRKWQFPQGTIIGAGEYKIVLCDGARGSTDVGVLRASFKLNRTAGETLAFTDPEGRVLDKVILPVQRTDISYGRTLGMSGFFYYETPTPFQMNGQGFAGYAEEPSLTEAPGTYFSTVYAQINVPEGTQVYYTTDGSDPTTASTPYNGERLELNFTTVLRARAFAADPNLQPSEIVTGTYLINAYHTLPIVSLVTNPANLWDPVNGMLAEGNILKEAPGKLPFKNSTYRAVKDSGARFPVHVEMYDTDGTQILNQGAQFSLMGDYSLDMPQKSMKFRAKSLYGAKTFAAALFPDREYTEYKSFVLRNSGNDSMWTRLQDGFESRLLDYYGATVIHQAWRPVAVYLNGTYWGHMNLRERVDKFFVAQHEGLPFDQADDFDILQASGSTKYGSNKEFKAMLKKIKAGNPAKNEEDLQYILDNVDVDNLFEYMALEMFVGNSDIGNTRFYRLKGTDGKWKWIWYDADYGLFMSNFDSPKSYTKEKGMGQQNIDNTIFRKLLSVPEYKDQFLRKLGDVFQTLTTKTMLEILEPLVEQITPEMELHWARWGEENDQMVLSEVPTTVDGAYRYWEKRVERLRNVCRKRPTYLWEMVQNAFDLTNAQMVEYLGEKPDMPPDAV